MFGAGEIKSLNSLNRLQGLILIFFEILEEPYGTLWTRRFTSYHRGSLYRSRNVRRLGSVPRGECLVGQVVDAHVMLCCGVRVRGVRIAPTYCGCTC